MYVVMEDLRGKMLDGEQFVVYCATLDDARIIMNEMALENDMDTIMLEVADSASKPVTEAELESYYDDYIYHSWMDEQQRETA